MIEFLTAFLVSSVITCGVIALLLSAGAPLWFALTAGAVAGFKYSTSFNSKGTENGL